MDTGFTEFWQAAKDVCFPPACLACGTGLAGAQTRQDMPLCRRCFSEIALIHEPLCRLCGLPLPDGAGGNHLCGVCLTHTWHFSLARAVVQYRDPLARIIQAFKYHEETAGLAAFAALRDSLPHLRAMMEPDRIIPVPLHRRRLRDRGFNQALRLARAFFPEQKNKIDVSSLQRHRYTVAQTGLSGAERRKNIKGAFMVSGINIAGGKILLVDDVFTTGTTVNECAWVLCRAGAREVQVLTLARVLR